MLVIQSNNWKNNKKKTIPKEEAMHRQILNKIVHWNGNERLEDPQPIEIQINIEKCFRGETP